MASKHLIVGLARIDSIMATLKQAGAVKIMIDKAQAADDMPSLKRMTSALWIICRDLWTDAKRSSDVCYASHSTAPGCDTSERCLLRYHVNKQNSNTCPPIYDGPYEYNRC